jgi:hypothetical protein
MTVSATNGRQKLQVAYKLVMIHHQHDQDIYDLLETRTILTLMMTLKNVADTEMYQTTKI